MKTNSNFQNTIFVVLLITSLLLSLGFNQIPIAHAASDADATNRSVRQVGSWTTIMTETFEGTFPPNSTWTVFDNDLAVNGEYYWDDDSFKPYSGSWSAWVANGGANWLDPATSNYANNMQSWMRYGPFDLSDATDAELLFYYWNQSETNFDQIKWGASIDGANFYSVVGSYDTTQVGGNVNGWVSVNFDLTAVPTLGNVTGDSSVWIAFIFNSDSTVNSYKGAFIDDITLQKFVTTAPEIEVRSNDTYTLVPDGDTTPNADEGTDFGSADITSGSVSHWLRVWNQGSANLNLTGSPRVVISGANAADFTVNVQPASPIGGGGNSAQFELIFNPSGTGTRTATVSIANDDSDENPYNFTIQGTGTTTTAPEIEVRSNDTYTLVPDGDTTPNADEGTDFGSADITSGSVSHWLRVWNQGSANLNLTGSPRVVISGANAADFTVNVQPASPIGGGGNSAQFELIFNPSGTGLRTATVSIANNDSDENPYNFTIQGLGTGAVIQGMSFRSIGVYDGFVLESTETSNLGGSFNVSGTVFTLGDDALDRQYRSILSFNTADLPDNAVITTVILKIKKQGQTGLDPFTVFGKLKVDIRKPYFGARINLDPDDFQASTGGTWVGTFSVIPVSNWYKAVIVSAGYPYINLAGITQFRLRFNLDDNDNRFVDKVNFYSGDHTIVDVRPVLIIKYYLP